MANFIRLDQQPYFLFGWTSKLFALSFVFTDCSNWQKYHFYSLVLRATNYLVGGSAKAIIQDISKHMLVWSRW